MFREFFSHIQVCKHLVSLLFVIKSKHYLIELLKLTFKICLREDSRQALHKDAFSKNLIANILKTY